MNLLFKICGWFYLTIGGRNMTNTRHNFRRLAILTALSMALLACTGVVRAVAETPTSLSKKELKTFSATPADQERLAAYYRNKAEHLRARAQEFSAQADYLATQPATIKSNRVFPATVQATIAISQSYIRKEAKDAEALAAQHEKLAEDYRSKTVH
jgi:hypothetical protein